MSEQPGDGARVGHGDAVGGAVVGHAGVGVGRAGKDGVVDVDAVAILQGGAVESSQEVAARHRVIDLDGLAVFHNIEGGIELRWVGLREHQGAQHFPLFQQLQRGPSGQTSPAASLAGLKQLTDRVSQGIHGRLRWYGKRPVEGRLWFCSSIRSVFETVTGLVFVDQLRESELQRSEGGGPDILA